MNRLAKRNRRKSASQRICTTTANVECLEKKSMMSATNEFPANEGQALANLLAQESRDLTVRQGQIHYGNEPVRLIGYGDYGMLSEFDFNQNRFFKKLNESGANMVRVWLQYQWSGNDGLSPFSTNSKNGKYDLTTLNDKYFERLDEFLKSAESKGVVVQLNLFDIITLKNDGATVDRWGGSPFNPANQQNGHKFSVGGGDHKSRLYSFNHDQRLWQEALEPLIERTVVTTSKYGNVILEVMNEPEEPGTGVVAGTEAFHKKVITAIRATDQTVPIAVNGHPDGSLLSFANKKDSHIDIITVHARSRDKFDNTGESSDKELQQIASLVRDSAKPIIISNDGDLTQVNPTRKNQKSSDDRTYGDDNRADLIEDMMNKTFSSGKFGKAHFEILDKGLNGDTWLSDNYHVSHGDVDASILKMLSQNDDANHNPEANADRFRTRQDQARTFNLIRKKNPDRNDSDNDGQRLRIAEVLPESRAGGTIERLPGRAGRQKVTYTPPVGFSGRDVFWYSVTDGRGGRDVARVTVNVRAPKNVRATMNTRSTIDLGVVDVQMSGGVQSVTQPSSGHVSIGSDNRLSYTPRSGFFGTDEFEYAMDDGQGELIFVPVRLQVSPASVDSGVLRITGNGNANRIVISGTKEIRVAVDGHSVTYSSFGVKTIEARSMGGNDSIINQTNLPMIAYGGDGDDRIEGGTSADRLFGEAGVDSLFGGSGMDWLDGGYGNDHLHGGRGNDRLLGQAGNDTLEGRNGDDRLEGGDGNDVLYGNAGNDAMYGQAGDDAMFGETGDDTMRGGHGNDFMRGDEGNDNLDGGHGNDHLQGMDGNDYLEGSDGHDLLEGGAGDDKLRGGAGVDVLYGNGGSDLLSGGSNTDYLFGGRGDDRLYGDSGNDLMDGGQGNDRMDGRSDNWWSARKRRFRGWIWG